MALEVAQLLDMNQEQLDDLFRNSPVGQIPKGEGDGMVIIATGTQLSGDRSALPEILRLAGQGLQPRARGSPQ